MSNVLVLMDSFAILKQQPFPDFLQALLNSYDVSKADLHQYLFDQGFYIEKTSMYRYFNPNPKVTRIPDEDFLHIFAQCLGMSDTHREALLAIRQMKRRQQRVHRSA